MQCLPNRCGNPVFNVNMGFTYDLAGNLTKDTHFMGASSGTQVDTNYTMSPAGEVLAISNTLTGTTNYSGVVLSSIQGGANGPISYLYGNGRQGTSVYDSLGRLTAKECLRPS